MHRIFLDWSSICIIGEFSKQLPFLHLIIRSLTLQIVWHTPKVIVCSDSTGNNRWYWIQRTLNEHTQTLNAFGALSKLPFGDSSFGICSRVTPVISIGNFSWGIRKKKWLVELNSSCKDRVTVHLCAYGIPARGYTHRILIKHYFIVFCHQEYNRVIQDPIWT